RPLWLASRDHPLMAFDDQLAKRVRDVLAEVPDVTEQRMLGGLAFPRRRPDSSVALTARSPRVRLPRLGNPAADCAPAGRRPGAGASPRGMPSPRAAGGCWSDPPTDHGERAGYRWRDRSQPAIARPMSRPASS